MPVTAATGQGVNLPPSADFNSEDPVSKEFCAVRTHTSPDHSEAYLETQTKNLRRHGETAPS